MPENVASRPEGGLSVTVDPRLVRGLQRYLGLADSR